MTAQSLATTIVGINIRIDCGSGDVHELLASNFEGMTTAGDSFDLEYRVRSCAGADGFIVSRQNSDFRQTAKDTGALIYFLESDLVVQSQLLRPDLLFLHSAVVSDGGKAHLVTGPSGAGKSTTSWGLLHHGFGYVSDELAPVSLAQLLVSTYSHAICLKSPLPTGYPVPAGAFVTNRGTHIPPSAMPAPTIDCNLPVGSVFFVEHRPDFRKTVIEPVGHAEAATRLYPNILNALAHPNDGLDAALQLTQDVGCYRIEAADLASTCATIASTIRG
jgi:hypothetical protein